MSLGTGHWYRHDGTPVYETPSAKGDRMVRTTLVHARKQNLYPGVTTIIRCAAAPQLTNWLIEQAVMSALTLPRQTGESDKDFVKRVIQDSERIAEEAAEKGSEIHAALEAFFQGRTFEAEYTSHVRAVAALLHDKCGEQPWVAEKAVAHKDGFATKIDLHSHEWLIDFKSKDFTADEAQKLDTHSSHWMQLAAGDQALSGNGPAARKCAIVYVSRNEPGTCAFLEVGGDKLERGWEMFTNMLSYWKNLNNYYPE